MPYYSSADCQILIGPTASPAALQNATEVVGINISETEQVLPIYGWRDREWSRMAKGQFLVTGSIIYNARVPNYIPRLVSGQTVPIPGTSGHEKYVKSKLDVKQRIAELTSNIDIGLTDSRALLEVARLNKKYNFDEDEHEYTNASVSMDDLPESIVQIRRNKSGIIEQVEGVFFTGRATEVQGGSAGNIKYAQSFVARRMKELVPSSVRVPAHVEPAAGVVPEVTVAENPNPEPPAADNVPDATAPEPPVAVFHLNPSVGAFDENDDLEDGLIVQFVVEKETRRVYSKVTNSGVTPTFLSQADMSMIEEARKDTLSATGGSAILGAVEHEARVQASILSTAFQFLSQVTNQAYQKTVTIDGTPTLITVNFAKATIAGPDNQFFDTTISQSNWYGLMIAVEEGNDSRIDGILEKEFTKLAGT